MVLKHIHQAFIWSPFFIAAFAILGNTGCCEGGRWHHWSGWVLWSWCKRTTSGEHIKDRTCWGDASRNLAGKYSLLHKSLKSGNLFCILQSAVTLKYTCCSMLYWLLSMDWIEQWYCTFSILLISYEFLTSVKDVSFFFVCFCESFAGLEKMRISRQSVNLSQNFHEDWRHF